MNLTPHVLNVIRQDGSVMNLVPSGTVARVQEVRGEVAMTVDGVEIRRPSTWGQVVGLPDSQDGQHIFIVSAMVSEALGGSRGDVVRPGELVRSPDGQPIGCRGLIWAA